MTKTENTGIAGMTIKKLTLHRETVRELAGSRDGALSGNSGSSNNTFLSCFGTCKGHTCNKKCP